MTETIERRHDGDDGRASLRTWLWVIVALGALLRLYRLDFQSLWLDEGLQYYVATRNTMGEILSQTRSFHPPLSFLLNRAFLLVNDSDFFLRLPSALFGIASLPVMYLLARELTSRRAALLAVYVLAISPFHIWYSQEGRMYSQVLFFSLLSSALLMQALKRGGVRWWVYYVLAGAAGMYTHVFMLLALVVQGIWVLLCHRRHLLSIAASGVAIAVLFLPWALILPFVGRFLEQAGSVIVAGTPSNLSIEPHSGKAGFSLAALPYTFFAYAAGFSLGPSVAELHENKSLSFILSFWPTISLVAVLFGPLLLAGMIAMYRRSGARPFFFALLGLGLPVAAVVAYSLMPRATFNVRYTLVAFPFFSLFVGTALALGLRANKRLGAALVLAVSLLSSASIYNHFANPRYAKEDVRSAVQLWRRSSEDVPLLTFRGWWAGTRYVGASGSERHFRLDSNHPVSTIERIFSSQSAPSVYVLLARDWNQTREKTIREAFGGVEEHAFPGVKVLKISRPNGLAPREPRDDMRAAR